MKKEIQCVIKNSTDTAIEFMKTELIKGKWIGLEPHKNLEKGKTVSFKIVENTGKPNGSEVLVTYSREDGEYGFVEFNINSESYGGNSETVYIVGDNVKYNVKKMNKDFSSEVVIGDDSETFNRQGSKYLVHYEIVKI
ncbi:MAG: hypothetical protein HRT66_11010 [Flavobacteriaceae bacterium]|nr:hypothetical protein [Flavobacteriaceae bacterium]